jgi:hypothetical protein
MPASNDGVDGPPMDASLPAPPVATSATVSNAAPAASPTSSAPYAADRISGLPDDVLRDVISRLPTKDAARTTAFSRRWRGVWPSTPLVLADSHSHSLPAATVSRALAAHPGPFRCVYLAGASVPAHPSEVARLLQLLAVKDIQDLVLANRPTTDAADLETLVTLPGAIFACTSLTRLDICFWSFPDIFTLPPAAVFPSLRELNLVSIAVDERELTFLLERCPVLEKLVVFWSRRAVPICIRSSSLRCVHVCSSAVPAIAVGHASVLERLLLWGVQGENNGPVPTSTTIRIGYAPRLRFLGFLVPGMHTLVIGNTVIKAGTKACASITVPSVQTLAIQVKLGTHIKAMMLPSLLRCFPNTETLYVQVKINLKPDFIIKFICIDCLCAMNF